METRRDFIKGALAAGLLAPAIDANALDYFDTQYKLETPLQKKGMPNPIQPQPITLTPEQQMATVRQLIFELDKANRFRKVHNDVARKREEGYRNITNKELDNIDPMLVGKNVVFSKKWNDWGYIGDKKVFTQEQFERWRDNADRIYDAYKELIGDSLKYGKKVIVGSCNKDPVCTWTDANIIGYNISQPANPGALSNNFTQIKEAGCDYSMLSELATIFMNGKEWKGGMAVSWCSLMIAYALEKTPVRYNNEYSGEQYREKGFNYAQEAYGNNKKLYPFTSNGKSAFEYYLFGFVDEVGGWEPYKKAFQSYDDPSTSYKPKKYNDKNKDILTARDFFDRVAHFSGQKDLLESLPDKGSFFKVTEVIDTTPSLRDRSKK